MANLEFTIGSEQHSSNWGKYFVKGLEEWQCKESSTSDRHESYQEYCCLDVPEGTVFTIFEQSGNKRGTEIFSFQICVADHALVNSDSAVYGDGKIAGNYKVIAHGKTATKAPRLMGWWIDGRKDQDPLAFAQHCADFIDKRGVKNLPDMICALGSPADPLKSRLQDLVKEFGLEALKASIASL